MKNTRGMFALLTAVFALLLCPKAHASWEIVCRDNGSGGSGSREPGNNTKTVASDEAKNAAGAGALAQINSGEALSFTIEAKVKIKVYAVWRIDPQELEDNPDAANAPIPKKLLVREECWATGVGSAWYSPHGGGSGSVGLAFGDPDPVHTEWYPGVGSSQTGHTFQWTVVDNSGGEIEVLVGERTVTANASVSGSLNVSSGLAQANANYRANPYAYPEIYSPQIEPSYYKDTDGERKLHVNDDPSKKEVTSSVSYYNGGRWFSSNTLYTHSPYDWEYMSLDYLWRYSGDGEMDSLAQQGFDTHSYVSYPRLLFDFPPEGATKNTTFKVNIVGDELLPILSAQYAVQWHLPWDNWQRYGNSYLHWQPLEGGVYSPSDGAVEGTAVIVTYFLGNPYYAAAEEGIDKAGKVMGVFELFRLPVAPALKTLVSAAGLVIGDDSADEEVSYTVPWGWGDPNATYAPDNKKAQKYYRMFATVEREYRISFWNGDAYDTHGYVGLSRQAIKKDTQGRRTTRSFVFVGEDTDDTNGDPRGNPRGGTDTLPVGGTN